MFSFSQTSIGYQNLEGHYRRKKGLSNLLMLWAKDRRVTSREQMHPQFLIIFLLRSWNTTFFQVSQILNSFVGYYDFSLLNFRLIYKRSRLELCERRSMYWNTLQLFEHNKQKRFLRTYESSKLRCLSICSYLFYSASILSL